MRCLLRVEQTCPLVSDIITHLGAIKVTGSTVRTVMLSENIRSCLTMQVFTLATGTMATVTHGTKRELLERILSSACPEKENVFTATYFLRNSRAGGMEIRIS